MDSHKIIKLIFKRKFRGTIEILNLILSKILVGKKVKAFGPNGNGYWGSNDKEISYKIIKVKTNGDDEDGYFHINLYLTDLKTGKPYSYNKYGLIYTDEVFDSYIQKLIPPYIRMEYSEQGMQGSNFVNYDVWLKI
jgi:hypothetical protein